MKSRVFFTQKAVGNTFESLGSRVRRLYDAAGIPACILPGDMTAIKLHFGERGNESYIHPVYVREVVQKVLDAGAHPFLTDTCTLYHGGRFNAPDHILTAYLHGFSYSVVGAPVIIADGLAGDDYRPVKIRGHHFAEVKIGSAIAAAQSMVVLSHFKGHGMAGFGGAIKNLAMGCAAKPGKMEQHQGMRPRFNASTCSACGNCANTCPVQAITVDTVAQAERERCIGCAECMAVCPTGSIDFDWDQDLRPFMEMLTEYASGAVSGKEGKTGYINFLLQLVPDCDCVPWSDVAIAPDIGVLASLDPVAIDQASLDLVNASAPLPNSRLAPHIGSGQDKFRGVWAKTQGEIQLEYGEELGIGSRDYELFEI